MSKCLVNFYLIAPRAGVSKSELVTWYSTFEHFWMMSHHSLSCWCPVTLKGIVHQKCLILSSFTPSSSSSKPALIYLFCWTQRKIFWRKFLTRLFWGNIDLHKGGGGIWWKSMVPQNCSVSHILQNIFLCVQQNKSINAGMELLEDE